MNKRGVSEIITTVVLVALALVAIGVVWVVVSNILERGRGDISSSSECLKVNLKIESANCNDPTTCSVTLSRGAGGDELGGVKLIFSDDTNSKVVDVPGNIEVLSTVTLTKDSGIQSANKVEIAPYFLKGEEEKLCQKSAPFDL